MLLYEQKKRKRGEKRKRQCRKGFSKGENERARFSPEKKGLFHDHALIIGIAVRTAIRSNLVAVDLSLRRAGRAIRHAALLAALHITVVLANRAIHINRLLVFYLFFHLARLL